MFPPHEVARLLVLGRNPDTDLLSLIGEWLPELELHLQDGSMASWLDELWNSSPDGLLLFTESLEVAELQVLTAWLATRPHIPALALVGARGLFGAEGILAHKNLKILPHPWSTSGLKYLLCPEAPVDVAQPKGSAEPDTDLDSDSDSKVDQASGVEKPEPVPAPAKKTIGPPSPPTTPKYSQTGSTFSSPQRSAKEFRTPSRSPKPNTSQCLPASKLDLSGSATPQIRNQVRDSAKVSDNKSPKYPNPPSLEKPTASPSASLPTPAFAGEFLDGLVERFRDPLASLSGHLQLLKVQSPDPNPLLAPALQAAREIEASLDALYLASDTHPVRPAKISGEHLAIEALKEAQRAGLSVQLDLDEDFLLRADENLVRVALQCARVLLSRFGGTENSELVLHCYRNSQRAALEWEIVRPSSTGLASGSISPPPFLSLLLQRFADRLDAEAVLLCTDNDVPQVVGLAWPASSALAPIG